MCIFYYTYYTFTYFYFDLEMSLEAWNTLKDLMRHSKSQSI